MFRQWFLWRFTLPMAVAAVVTYVTWGKSFFDVLTALLWTTFLGHLAVTLAFRRTHVLDTASFYFLLFCFNNVADMSESYGNRDPVRWAYAAAAFALYSAFSLIGRIRAVRGEASASTRSVSGPEVVEAMILLVLAVGICSTSKTAVGLLIVPALFFVPAVLLYALFKRSRRE